MASAGPELFYDLRHQVVYQAMTRLFDAMQPVEVVSVHVELKKFDELDQVGGAAFIADISAASASSASFDYYLEILEHKRTLRKIISTGVGAIDDAYESGDADASLDQFEKSAMSIRMSGVSEIQTAHQVCQASAELIDKHMMAFKTGKPSGIATGFPDIDFHTCGLETKTLTIIAARPSVGKSTLMMSMAEHMAINQGVPVGVISLEMTNANLMMRLESALSKVAFWKMRRGDLSDYELSKLLDAKATISKSPIFFCERGMMTVSELRYQIRQMVMLHKIKSAFVDYLQLVRAGVRTDKRSDEVGYVTASCKALAKELDIAITVASQLNRDCERRDDKTPTLADLRESGNIEQDADLVLLMHAKPDDIKLNPNAHIVNIIGAKQRNGPQFLSELLFVKPNCRFESLAKVSEDDSPKPYKD
jgi:replicative DNA helicase